MTPAAMLINHRPVGDGLRDARYLHVPVTPPKPHTAWVVPAEIGYERSSAAKLLAFSELPSFRSCYPGQTGDALIAAALAAVRAQGGADGEGAAAEGFAVLVWVCVPPLREKLRRFTRPGETQSDVADAVLTAFGRMLIEFRELDAPGQLFHCVRFYLSSRIKRQVRSEYVQRPGMQMVPLVVEESTGAFTRTHPALAVAPAADRVEQPMVYDWLADVVDATITGLNFTPKRERFVREYFARLDGDTTVESLAAEHKLTARVAHEIISHARWALQFAVRPYLGDGLFADADQG